MYIYAVHRNCYMRALGWTDLHSTGIDTCILYKKISCTPKELTHASSIKTDFSVQGLIHDLLELISTVKELMHAL